MSTNFDVSEKCKETIHKLLTENTAWNGLNPRNGYSPEGQADFDYRSRAGVIFAIFRHLVDFEREDKVKDTFWLTLRGDELIDSNKTNPAGPYQTTDGDQGPWSDRLTVIPPRPAPDSARHSA